MTKLLKNVPKRVSIKKKVEKKKDPIKIIDFKDSEQKNIEEQYNISFSRPYNHIYDGKKKTKLPYWKNWWYERKFPDRTYLINMELINGFHRTFLVKESEGGFSYKGKRYIVDNALKTYNLDAKMYQFDFHEGFAIPIERRIPVDSIKKTLESEGMSEIEYATNPSTLERFIISRIAEGIMKGQELDERLRKLLLLMIIGLIVGIIHLLFFLQKAGVFSSVKLPF